MFLLLFFFSYYYKKKDSLSGHKLFNIRSKYKTVLRFTWTGLFTTTGLQATLHIHLVSVDHQNFMLFPIFS